jgi:hypothetical protein
LTILIKKKLRSPRRKKESLVLKFLLNPSNFRSPQSLKILFLKILMSHRLIRSLLKREMIKGWTRLKKRVQQMPLFLRKKLKSNLFLRDQRMTVKNLNQSLSKKSPRKKLNVMRILKRLSKNQ